MQGTSLVIQFKYPLKETFISIVPVQVLYALMFQPSDGSENVFITSHRTDSRLWQPTCCQNGVSHYAPQNLKMYNYFCLLDPELGPETSCQSVRCRVEAHYNISSTISGQDDDIGQLFLQEIRGSHRT